MNDDLQACLDTWHAPALSERATRRITSLLDDRTLPGPLVRTRRMIAVPLIYAVAVAALVVVTAPRRRDAPAVLSHGVRVTRALVEAPDVPASAQSAAVAVTAIDLDGFGFELVARPHIRVNRVTP
jgi:hypothetical protein